MGIDTGSGWEYLSNRDILISMEFILGLGVIVAAFLVRKAWIWAKENLQ